MCRPTSTGTTMQARNTPLLIVRNTWITVGSTAGLSFSLNYTAPEVLSALESGCDTILVDAAVDMWAVGVIAFELLTGEPAFQAVGWPSPQSQQPVRDAIAGRAQLPWEEGGDTAAQRLRRLRGLRKTVTMCLQRDPSKRPSADALLDAWDHVFDEMTTEATVA